MTPEQINAIAREYAESVNPIESYEDDIVERNMDIRIERDSAIPVLQWLSERYCLVEQSKVKEAHEKAVKAEEWGDRGEDNLYATHALETLFPELFN